MRFISRMFTVLMLTGLLSTTASAGIFSDDAKTGTLKGRVNFCGKGGVDGMQVYIPGLPYVVITEADGRFAFPALPVGKYDVHYRVGAQLLNRNLGVKVMDSFVTDLSEISFCDQRVSNAATTSAPMPTTLPAAIPSVKAVTKPVVVDESKVGGGDAIGIDADGDGVIAAQDCDDNNAKIYPGALEACDGIDNNCNGQVDENALIFVANGIGNCDAGKVVVASCKEGFSDCDRDPSNGCEIDIKNDAEHCGACFDACTPTEICVAGGCE